MSASKTNALRILDSAKIKYNIYTYECNKGAVDGVTVAQMIGKPVEQVFKTLVTKGSSKEYYVFVVPVFKELNLKAAAKAVGEKSIEMIRVDEINKVTGYIRGGCSPVGMKKAYSTVVDSSCEALQTMIMSAGKIGMQMELEPQELIRLIGAKTAEIAE